MSISTIKVVSSVSLAGKRLRCLTTRPDQWPVKLLRSNFSLMALQVFVTVARMGSFTRAADSVCLTQSAVSKQISSLEDALGAPLFVRAGGVRLTQAGQEFLEAVEPALDRIARAVDRIERSDEKGTMVSLLAPPAVLQYWLISLMPEFVDAHPEIDLRLTPQLMSAATPRLDLDADIRFGSGVWQGVRARYLFGREMCVIASPEWLGKQPLRTVDDLAGARLFGHSLYPTAWTEWRHAMEAAFQPRDIQAYDHYSVMIEAVMAGLGVGLVPRLLVRKFLAGGELIAPFNEAMLGSSGYYLVLSDRRGRSRHVNTVGDWIREQAEILSQQWLDSVTRTVFFSRG